MPLTFHPDTEEVEPTRMDVKDVETLACVLTSFMLPFVLLPGNTPLPPFIVAPLLESNILLLTSLDFMARLCCCLSLYNRRPKGVAGQKLPGCICCCCGWSSLDELNPRVDSWWLPPLGARCKDARLVIWLAAAVVVVVVGGSKYKNLKGPF